jgi:glycine/D-amino acid oxidase-like deaminating enzyme
VSPPVDRIASDEALPAAVDVVVIGGGIIGVCAAYSLAQRRINVALVEKAHVGAEQSSRNWGWCRQQGRDPLEIPLSRASLELWGGLAAEIGVDIGFRRTGVLFVTRDDAEVESWLRWSAIAREHQVHSRVLTAAEVAAMLPDSPIPWLAGLHTASDGRAEPARAAPAIAAAARMLGATIHQDCAARGLETQAGAVSAVVTERGTIRTSAVLCAAGAWASLWCRRHGIDLPQANVRGSVLATAPAPQLTEGAIGTPELGLRRRLDGGYTIAMRGRGTVDLTPQTFRYAGKFWPTWQQRRRNLKLRIGRDFLRELVAGSNWRLDQVSPFEAVRVLDPEPDRALIDRALAETRAAFPILSHIQVSATWGGVIDSTPDAIPVISPVDALPGLHLATGFSGHGFGVGPAAGRLSADLISGHAPAVDPFPFRYTRLIDGTRLAPNSAL